MAKLQEKYESLVIISAKLGEDGVKEIVSKITALIEQDDTLDGVDEWGKRRLAYAINYETEGFYVIFNYTSVPSLPAEVERRLQITEGVLRVLNTKRLGE